MILIYQAQNSVEARLILNLFQQAGLSARIDGEYLQGGMGDLQVSGIVRMMIDEADLKKGKEIIRQWDSKEDIDIKTNSNPSAPENRSENSYPTLKWKFFIIIISLAGLL
ncbi:MAG: DUF2007 domain-containing protein, partial [Proteobacteria bacterium]|nr:DUF2007 domain-containing protein [Pseudomonadota bacterium]